MMMRMRIRMRVRIMMRTMMKMRMKMRIRIGMTMGMMMRMRIRMRVRMKMRMRVRIRIGMRMGMYCCRGWHNVKMIGLAKVQVQSLTQKIFQVVRNPHDIPAQDVKLEESMRRLRLEYIFFYCFTG